MGVEYLAIGDHSDNFSNEHRMQAKLDLLDQIAFQGIGKFFDDGQCLLSCR